MTTRPYELLARFAKDGTVGGASVRRIATRADGREEEGDPVPLSEVAEDPAFVKFAEQFAAAAVTERDSLRTLCDLLQSQITTLTGERDQLAAALESMTSERDGLIVERDQLASDKAALSLQRDQLSATAATLRTEIATLTAELDALLHPPGPDLTTRDGVRQYVSAARYDRETGGFNVGSQFISTQRDEVGHWFPRFWNALMWIQGDARIRAINPQGHYPYKPKGFPPVVLTAAQVLRIYECMAWYINECFAIEAVLYDRLNANEPLDVIVTASDADHTWPSRQFTWEPPA